MPNTTEIRNAQKLAIVRIKELTVLFLTTADEILLSMELPLDCASGESIETAPAHVQEAGVRFKGLAKLYLETKHSVEAFYADEIKANVSQNQPNNLPTGS